LRPNSYEDTINNKRVDEKDLPVSVHLLRRLNTNPSKTQTGGSKLLGINVIIKPLTNPLRRL